MDALKDVGIEKLDLLGLKTLTVMANALAAIERHHGIKLRLQDIPMDDAKTYAMLSVERRAGCSSSSRQGCGGSSWIWSPSGSRT